MMCLPSNFFKFWNEPIWLVHHSKKWNYGQLPKIKCSILKYRVVPPLWPTYVGEKRTTIAKAYRIKIRYYWELFGEHIRNLGTLCFEPAPAPNQKKKQKNKKTSLNGNSTAHCASGKWTVDSPLAAPITTWSKKTRPKEAPSSMTQMKLNFSLVAWRFYS
jgi:hypothetical protein